MCHASRACCIHLEVAGPELHLCIGSDGHREGLCEFLKFVENLSARWEASGDCMEARGWHNEKGGMTDELMVLWLNQVLDVPPCVTCLLLCSDSAH